MAGLGTKITATDYNAIQSKIKQVLGTGAGDYGYGPDDVLVSSAVAAHQRITVTQWRNLRTDILKARTHQVATPGTLVDPAVSLIITASAATTNRLTTSDTSALSSGLSITFTGTVFGGISTSTTYYIKQVIDSTQFTISETSGGSVLPLTAGAGSMTMRFSGRKITEDDRLAYYNMAVDCQTDRLVTPPAGQASSTTLAIGTRSTAWNGVLTHTVTLTFASADAMRYYFNTGSELRITGSRSGGANTTKDQSWTSLLTGMGIIKFNHNSTTCTGTGLTSAIGYRQLTSSAQEIFRKNASSYLPNSYYVTARLNAAIATATQIIFVIRFDDANVPPPSTPVPGFQIDEDVTGTTTSTVVTYHSSGSVTVAPPTGPGAITL